jgi:amino acid adenylation domain-containing protein
MTLPLTESQKGLLALVSRVPTKHLYNQIIQFDVDPVLVPPDGLLPALRTLVEIQPALRQTFRPLPAQHADLTPVAEPFPFLQREVPAHDYANAVVAMCRQLSLPAFDLADGPAYRCGTVRATDNSAATALIVVHHLVADGVSMWPLVRDLEAWFAGQLLPDDVPQLRAKREALLRAELTAQARVAADAGTVRKAKEWAERLRSVPPLVLSPLPNRPTRTSFAGARVTWQLTEAEAARFAGTCRRLSITSFALLAGIYGAVLGRHGGVGQVLVGSPFVARRTVGAFELCGFFVNTLPITVDLDWSQSVDSFLTDDVNPAVNQCRSTVDVSFNQLVQYAHPDRSSDRNPLFSCMLAMQDTFDLSAAKAIIRVREPAVGSAKFDLWLGAFPVDGSWRLELEYDTELIAPAMADAILDSLRTALRRAIGPDRMSVADLFDDTFLTAGLRNDGYPARVGADTLIEWFQQSVVRNPHSVAIEAPEHRLTYAQLVERVRLAAADLADRGAGPGDVVGLALDNLADTVIAILAILWRGAAFLPLDAGLPEERLAYMAEKAGCKIVLRSDVDLVGSAVKVECLASPDGPVYVMFTSGSTGRPKGVHMGHRPLLNLTGWQHAALKMGPETRFLQYAPLGFDVSYQEIIPTLLCGGTVVSREPADRRDFPAVLRRIVDTAVTHIYLPVAALRPLVQCAVANQIKLPDLRYLCVSGEQLLVDDEIRDFFVAHPHLTLVNLYGPTETHAVTSHRLSARDQTWPVHVPIGLPYPNVYAHVVDVTGHLAPVGVPGELYLGGACPADGYINDPEITSERFVADTFSGGRAYRTGDRVVRDVDDLLVFLGREDGQIKIRGYRIELGEIQTVAMSVPGVREVAVVASGSGVDQELAMFVLGDADHDAIRTKLARTLPDYMVPTWIFPLTTMPTTATGKTDVDALTALAGELVDKRRGVTTQAEYADDLERELAEIWAAVLEVPTVTRDRPVMAYGAHSLNIFTALAQVQERYGVAVPVAGFFESPTVATLADLVRAEWADT